MSDRMRYQYTLKMPGDRYYVGTTNNPGRRLEDHYRGAGSKFTSQHGVETCVKMRPVPADQASAIEREETLSLMREHGIDNVRGSKWTQRTLPEQEKQFLKGIITHDQGHCYTCGGSGHYANGCPHRACGRCGRSGHSTHECYARTSSSGYRLMSSSSEDDGPSFSSSSGGGGACYRCGRSNHWASDCYARTDVYGDYL